MDGGEQSPVCGEYFARCAVFGHMYANSRRNMVTSVCINTEIHTIYGHAADIYDDQCEAIKAFMEWQTCQK
jgi:hypothetical protein